MTNIDIIGEHLIMDFIPTRYKRHYGLVKKDDLVALVAITDMQKKQFNVSWIKVDSSEIGKEVKYAGQIVIRAIEK